MQECEEGFAMRLAHSKKCNDAIGEVLKGVHPKFVTHLCKREIFLSRVIGKIPRPIASSVRKDRRIAFAFSESGYEHTQTKLPDIGPPLV